MPARAWSRAARPSWWCTLALAATLAAPGVAAGADGPQLLVWSAAPSEEAGEAELARLRQLAHPLAPVWQVPGAAVVPAAAAGAGRGGFLVIAGACDAQGAAQALQVVRALKPDAAARPLSPEASAQLGEPPCPGAPEGNPGWRAGAPVRGAHGALAFVGLPFTRGAVEGSLGTSRAGLRLFFLLLDPRKRALVDSAEYRPPGESAALRSLTATARGVALKVEYADPACEGEAERFVPWRAEITAAADGQRLHLQDSALTRLREAPCGAAAEPAGGGAPAGGTGHRAEPSRPSEPAADDLVAFPE